MNDSGWSQPGPANAFSFVSAHMLLELKAKLVMARTKRICVQGRGGRRKRRGCAFQVSQENIKSRAKGRGG